MLKNLIKYDVKKMTFILPYFYLATLVFAGLTRFINIWSDIQFFFILGQIFQGTTIALIVNSLINTLISILIRSFRFSLYGDESYLTHTLPVSKKQLLLSKFISSLIVLFATILVIVASLLIVFYSSDLVNFIKANLSVIVIGLDISVGGLIALFVLAVFFQLLSMLLTGFASIVKGHSYNNGKVGKSFTWFAIFYLVQGVLSIALVALVLLISGNISEIFATVMKAQTFITILVTATVVYLGYTIAFYFITYKMFNKGVNVD